MNKSLKGKKPLLGVIGGMGTQATACFYEKLHNLQNVTTEQEYLDVLLYSMPTIPDRTAFITGQSTDSPLEPLIHSVKTLETAGATCIAITCVTSHYFYGDITKAVNIPVLSMLEETAGFISKQGIKKVCLLATDGTLKGKAFHTAFEKFGIEPTTPPEKTQSDLMTMIYEIKRGTAVLPEQLERITEEALKSGAEAVVLGCTELCIIAKENPGIINTLEVLAGASIKTLVTRNPSMECQL